MCGLGGTFHDLKDAPLSSEPVTGGVVDFKIMKHAFNNKSMSTIMCGRGTSIGL